jgi:hypothetical protein
MYRSPDPALEPLTVTHFRECPLHKDAVLTMECLNCSELVAPDATQCNYCGAFSWWDAGTSQDGYDMDGPWQAEAECRCVEIDEGLQADEAERRAAW